MNDNQEHLPSGENSVDHITQLSVKHPWDNAFDEMLRNRLRRGNCCVIESPTQEESVLHDYIQLFWENRVIVVMV